MKQIILLIGALVCALALVADAACPNNCNAPNGRCEVFTNKCNCTDQWAGDDCSYVLKKLTSGVPYSEQNLPTFGWAYFFINVPVDADLVWSINQTSDGGDCDVYIKRDEYPTRSNYDVRDISTDKQVVIQQTLVQKGRWYAGVYGFIQCSFSISVTTSAGACANNCSGHGTCGPDRVCTCDVGYSGQDCSVSDKITPNTPISDSVGQGVWKVYSYDVTSVPATLTFVLNQTTSGDADLYLNEGRAPSISEGSYVASNTTMLSESTIVYEALTKGTYYIGVFGFWVGNNPGGVINYQLTLVTAGGPNNCANTTRCSGPSHGTCTATGCRCNNAFEGVDCETMKNLLTEKQNVTGFVTDSAWNYYRYAAIENKEFTITVTQTSTDADCDLYVRSDGRPDLSEYDWAEFGQARTFSLTVPEPSNSIWWIGVYGWIECSYSLTVGDRTDTTCNNGVWDPSIDGCVCNSGWAGAFCDEKSSTLASGVVVNGTVAYNAWSYYTIDIPEAHSLEFRLKETTTNSTDRGTVWLYVSAEDYPTLHNYDQSDTSTDDQVHSVHVSSAHYSLSGTYYVGVYGSPYGKADTTNSFSLVAWFTDF